MQLHYFGIRCMSLKKPMTGMLSTSDMTNLPSDNKEQPDSPKLLLHWGVWGQTTSVVFQQLVHTEEQPCQAFPTNSAAKNNSVVSYQNDEGKNLFSTKSLDKSHCFQNKGLTLVNSQ